MKNDLNQLNIERDKDELYYKIMLIGSKGVGKTQILKRFCKEPFEEKYRPTFGMDFRVQKYILETLTITVQIIDVSGKHYPAKEILKEYIIDTDCFICTYDISKINTVNELNNLILEYERIIPSDNKKQCWYFVGNKTDLKTRECSENPEDLFSYTPLGSMGFLEISAKENKNIQIMFDNALYRIKNNKKNIQSKMDSVDTLKDINAKLRSETKDLIIKKEKKESKCSIF